MPTSPTSLLVDLPDAALWTSRTWTDFAKLPARARALVVLPLFGCADWGLGRPLDLEETLGTAVLRVALTTPAAGELPLVVLPPLRWVLGPYPHTVFGVEFETASALLREIGASVKAAGLRKLVLFNTSPWNEEFIDCGGRDLRVDLGLQTFGVNLAALGLDLHPVRSADRTAVQCAASACLAALPVDDESARERVTLRDFRPGNIAQPGPLRFSLPLDEAARRGKRQLAVSGRQLAALFTEIDARRPLTADGAIPAMHPPKVRSQSLRAGPRGGRRRTKR